VAEALNLRTESARVFFEHQITERYW